MPGVAKGAISGLNAEFWEIPTMLRFPVVRLCPAPIFSPPPLPHEDLLTNAELRAEALLRDAARAVQPGHLEIGEVVANFSASGLPLIDLSLAVRKLEGDDPCVSLCRLLSQLLARLNLHLEGAGR